MNKDATNVTLKALGYKSIVAYEVQRDVLPKGTTQAVDLAIKLQEQLMTRPAPVAVTEDTIGNIKNFLNVLVAIAHGNSVKSGWYSNVVTGERVPANVGEKLALVHSEISEALEGYRKGLNDDHLPHRKAIEVELADAVLRIADLCGYLELDLGAALVEKLEYNTKRSDHKLENRRKDGGKII
jgi:NTP pyrophosphatase (non-canonical NTP hydrolase)